MKARLRAAIEEMMLPVLVLGSVYHRKYTIFLRINKEPACLPMDTDLTPWKCPPEGAALAVACSVCER
ncbi:hypothetical protein J6590_023428 [Homalodisca vitripennis]|nr:hypothetical protein J6590_023428 [Homalodisca vitripennis]